MGKTLSILAALFLLSGCVETIPVKGLFQESHAPDPRWRFNDYRIIEGKGSVFTDTAKTYIIMGNGAVAKTVEADGNPKWEQHGSVIHIYDHPASISVTAVDGGKLKAKRSGAAAPAVEESPQEEEPAYHAPDEYGGVPFEPLVETDTTEVAGSLTTQR